LKCDAKLDKFVILQNTSDKNKSYIHQFTVSFFNGILPKNKRLNQNKAILL